MEREDGFISGYPNKLARTSSVFAIHQRHNSTAATVAAVNPIISLHNNNINNPNDQRSVPAQPPPSVIREQDQYMPIANVIRIMRRILPPHAKISDDAKETVQECVSEYISFITGEANERCHREQRKTITAEDVIWAMGKLGFDNYVEPLSVFLNRYRESESERTSAHREPILRRTVGDYGPIGLSPPYGPVFHMGPEQGFYDPSYGGYFRDGSGSGAGSSSQANNNNNNNINNNNMPGFDPFAQFK